MKIHQVPQRTPEWKAIRSRHFSASEIDSFALEPCKVTLTVEDMKAELDRLGIPRKGIAKRDDLIAALPNPDDYKQLSKGAMTAILNKINDERIQDIRDRAPDHRTEWDSQMLAWQDEMDAQKERKMEYNIPVQRGNLLEPDARNWYETHAGHRVTEVGFASHDTGGFGCSPDGLIETHCPVGWSHGLEIKCPILPTHLGYLLNGGLPDEYFWQVHMSMAVTGLSRWDFLSYCPGEAPLLIEVRRDEITDQLERGLIELVAHKSKIKARLAELWKFAYSKHEGGAS